MSQHLKHQQLVLLSTFHILLYSMNAFGYPIKRLFAYQSLPEPAPWINHCTSQFDSNSNSNNSLHLTMKTLVSNVMKSAKIANSRAKETKSKFVEHVLTDMDFETSVIIYEKNEWLPQIPSTSEEVLREITPLNAFFRAHEYIQFFAVGIEQILLDQIEYKEPMIEDIKALAYDNYKVLCEITIGMHLQGFTQKTYLPRSVMAHEYRQIIYKSHRILRDFEILREYVKRKGFMIETNFPEMISYVLQLNGAKNYF